MNNIKTLYFKFFSPSDNTGGAASQTSPLEQYLLLGRGARGAAAVQLIRQVLEAPGVYVFAELLEMPNMVEVINDRIIFLLLYYLSVFLNLVQKNHIFRSNKL